MTATATSDSSFNPADALDAGVIRQVRADVEALAQLLHEASSEVLSVHLPAVDATAITDWVSTARLSYDLTRVALSGMLEVAAAACTAVAWQYENQLIILDGQVLVAEAV